jgi:hypothetical protein
MGGVGALGRITPVPGEMSARGFSESRRLRRRYPGTGKGRAVRKVVLISCPQTGDLVPTGVTADVLDNLPSVNVLNGCPACGGDHDWRRDEAVITVISES